MYNGVIEPIEVIDGRVARVIAFHMLSQGFDSRGGVPISLIPICANFSVPWIPGKIPFDRKKPHLKNSKIFPLREKRKKNQIKSRSSTYPASFETWKKRKTKSKLMHFGRNTKREKFGAKRVEGERECKKSFYSTAFTNSKRDKSRSRKIRKKSVSKGGEKSWEIPQKEPRKLIINEELKFARNMI